MRPTLLSHFARLTLTCAPKWYIALMLVLPSLAYPIITWGFSLNIGASHCVRWNCCAANTVLLLRPTAGSATSDPKRAGHQPVLRPTNGQSSVHPCDCDSPACWTTYSLALQVADARPIHAWLQATDSWLCATGHTQSVLLLYCALWRTLQRSSTVLWDWIIWCICLLPICTNYCTWLWELLNWLQASFACTCSQRVQLLHRFHCSHCSSPPLTSTSGYSIFNVRSIRCDPKPGRYREPLTVHKDKDHPSLHNMMSLPGPKSGGGSYVLKTSGRISRHVIQVALLFCMLQAATGVRVAVAGDTTTPAEVMPKRNHVEYQTETKLCGIRNTGAQYTYVRKRAFKRAVARAQANGHTTYRGRQYTLEQLLGKHKAYTPSARRVQPDTSSHSEGPYLLSWNVGGLTTAILDELQIWLKQPANKCYKFVLLQETRWQWSSEWSNPEWHFLHSGHSKQKGAGVLTMISTAIASPEGIRSREVLHGRVQHTRVNVRGSLGSIDLVNVYQHAWDTRADAQELIVLRTKVLTAVENTVRAAPQRNLCVCAGDWNVQLKTMGSNIGANTVLTEQSAQAASDMDSLANLIRTLDLVALNTWSGARRKAYTYEHRECRTQIDYVLVRKREATHRMRLCKPLHGFPVTAWRLSGLHVPLSAYLEFSWKPQRQGPRSAQVDVDKVKHAILESGHDLVRFQQVVSQKLDGLLTYDTDQVNQVLLQQGAAFFPEQNRQPKPIHEDAGVQGITRCRWRHLHMCRQFAQNVQRTGARQLHMLFQSWKHFSKYRSLRREANRASRVARRCRFEGLLADAAEYAASQNLHKLFRVVRKLAPKQPYRKMKLYGPHGEILSPEQEASAIRVHFEGVLQGATAWRIQTPEMAVEVFKCDEILSELMRIPFHKAAPKHLAPGALWRAAAPVIAPKIKALLQCIWCQQTCVPQTWKDGWVALAQKPNKLGRSLNDFRPLCLQDPVGKSVLKLVAARIKPKIQQYASSCPQHAYLPGRSVEGALLAVFDRCREIRTIAQAARRDIFAKRMGTKAEPYAGGLVLSLDMSMAFDIVPRQHLQEALLEAGVAEADVALIMEWLQGSTYHIKHGTQDIRVETEKGVRQGCVLSPLLWTCFTCFVLKRLDCDIPLSDLQVYADDVLMSRIFRTKDQMLAALKAIPQLMQHLQRFGLKINVQKTAVLIRLAHRDGRTLLRQHLCRNKQGVYLKTIGHTPAFVPVKQQHNYLGCVLSLYDFETLTVKYRLEMCKNQFTRLRSVLMSQRCLSLSKRAYMWRVCVWTTLSYGLTCSGCTSMRMQLISGIVAKQLRSIARLPRHITHATNEEVHARVGVLMPADMLQQASQTCGIDCSMLWPRSRRLMSCTGRLCIDKQSGRAGSLRKPGILPPNS